MAERMSDETFNKLDPSRAKHEAQRAREAEARLEKEVAGLKERLNANMPAKCPYCGDFVAYDQDHECKVEA